MVLIFWVSFAAAVLLTALVSYRVGLKRGWDHRNVRVRQLEGIMERAGLNIIRETVDEATDHRSWQATDTYPDEEPPELSTRRPTGSTLRWDETR